MSKDNIVSPKYACIHHVFEHKAVEFNNHTAIRCQGEPLSYAELDARANHLARHLQTSGVCHGEVVAVALSYSVELIVSMLAILKCGGVYFPIDCASPSQRNLSNMEQADVKFVIGSQAVTEGYANQFNIVCSDDKSLFAGHLEAFDSYPSSPDDAAYIMFTSGSTGLPKGVLVPHRAVTRLVIDNNFVEITPEDAILQFATPSFDASTFEIWGALLNGACLVPFSAKGLDPNILKSDIEDNNITIMWLTAALFHLVADKFIDALTPLKVLLAGGDVLNPKYVNKVIDTIEGIKVVNGYGPTENTTFTSCHVMSADNKPDGSVPIGTAIRGTEVHIVDDQLNPVAKGETGELIASGPGVALGYLNLPYSESHFFYNRDIAEGLLYRTGDLVKLNEAGELLFVGRKDNLVKIRGFRVSLEEIKQNIVELEGVSDVLVTTRKFDSGDQILVANVKLHQTSEATASQLKATLATTLPDYMIPNKFVINRYLPINDNGKLDKKTILEKTN